MIRQAVVQVFPGLFTFRLVLKWETIWKILVVSMHIFDNFLISSKGDQLIAFQVFSSWTIRDAHSLIWPFPVFDLYDVSNQTKIYPPRLKLLCPLNQWSPDFEVRFSPLTLTTISFICLFESLWKERLNSGNMKYLSFFKFFCLIRWIGQN